MKTLTVTGKGSFQIREIDKPSLQSGAALIELKANTVCNQHDVAVMVGLHGGADYPLESGFPGHEGVGIVREIGPNAQGIVPGDMVVMTGIGGPPLYSQFVTRDQGTFFKVTPPRGYDADSLSTLELFGCVYHAVQKVESYENKDVAVVGLGAAGLAAIQLLKNFRPRSITGIDLNRDRSDKALRSGADRFLDASEFSGFGKHILETAKAQLCGNDKSAVLDFGQMPDLQFDIVIECTGNALSTAISFRLAKKEVIMFGYTRTAIPAFQPIWFETELTIKNSKILSMRDFAGVANLFNDGKIDPSILVTHRLNFSDYGKAVDLARTGEAIKVVLAW